jgi:hypothetical protein
MNKNALADWVYLPVSKRCVNLRTYLILYVNGALCSNDGAVDIRLNNTEAEALCNLISRGELSVLLSLEVKAITARQEGEAP